MKDDETLNSMTVLDAKIFSIADQKAGKGEFERFVTDTYRHLVALERKRMGGGATLEIFCRLDIGLFWKDDGDLGYFVNEVERTLTTSLWTRKLKVNFDGFAEKFATALIQWADTLISSN
jgi:hypothetical protein